MPEAITERLAGDARVMNGAGYALLLQVAHPVVGAGVAEHSNFREDPWGRLIRTLDYVNVTVFGGAAAAASMGARTRAMHKTIKGVLPTGERYHSLEPGPFAWVHATLAESILRCHSAFAASPTRLEKEAFWADWRQLGSFIGVRERDLPSSYGAFREYVAQMEAEVLEQTESVRTVLATLASPKRPPVPLLGDATWRVARWPATHSARLATAGLMRPAVRSRLGLGWSRRDAVEFAAFASAQRAAGPLLPAPLKDFGRTYLRWRGDALAPPAAVPSEAVAA